MWDEVVGASCLMKMFYNLVQDLTMSGYDDDVADDDDDGDDL